MVERRMPRGLDRRVAALSFPHLHRPLPDFMVGFRNGEGWVCLLLVLFLSLLLLLLLSLDYLLKLHHFLRVATVV